MVVNGSIFSEYINRNLVILLSSGIVVGLVVSTIIYVHFKRVRMKLLI